ncbi:syntaxin-11-like [Aulostomus maculatus]
MRDRLTHLHQVETASEGFTTVALDDLPQYEATASAVFSAEAARRNQDLDDILEEAQQIRLEILQIQNDISELKRVQYQALNQTSHQNATKWDIRTIAADIKSRGENVLRRLHMMNALSGEMKAQQGSSDPTTRIALAQYQYLSKALQQAMFSYNDTEMHHREACMGQIRRQMEVVGREVSEDELGEMIEREDWMVFSIQGEGKTAQAALLQIESRHKELLELERRVKEIQELFLDAAVLTEEQGTITENIQRNVQNTEATVRDTAEELNKAHESDKNNPFKKLFCGCFPCYYS